MRFKTETGSLYQVDLPGKRIRRISGLTPTTRVGEGEWKTFEQLYPSPICIGETVLIVWGTDPDRVRTTVTSRVLSFPPESPDN